MDKNVVHKPQPSLSILEMAPLDVLFEELTPVIKVFRYLEPDTLLILSRINHNFRKLLMSRDSQHVWQSSRQSMDPPCPNPPPLCSEPQWVHLLFNGRVCQVCHTKSYTWNDFSLGRRICTPCARNSLIAHGKVRKTLPTHCLPVLDLVPFTNIGPRSRCTDTRYYWLQDIVNVAAKIRQLGIDIASGKEGAVQAQIEFLKRRHGTVPPAREYLKECEDWYSHRIRELGAQHRKDLNDREKFWIRQFTELGYHEVDVLNMIHSDRVSLHGRVFNEAAWARIRAKHEPSVYRAREQRLTPLYYAALRKTYEDWFKTQPPQRWYYLPPFELLIGHQTVIDILRNAKAAINTPDADTFTHLLDRFDDICALWRKDRLAYLHGLRRNAIGSRPVNEQLVVYICTGCVSRPVLFGVDEAAIHCTIETCSQRLSVCPGIMTNVDYLLQLLGKDPSSATPLELDLLGKWFRCPSCMGRFRSNWRIFNWREMVEHCHPDTSDKPPLEIVKDPEELAAIESILPFYQGRPYGDWVCAHCSEFCYSFLRLEEVISHVQSKHGVDKPAEPADFLWAYNHRRAWGSGSFVEISAVRVSRDRCTLSRP